MATQNRVCVLGLWHLGCVYASCLAKLGYHVIGADEDSKIVKDLNKGKAPIYEPGLDGLIESGLADGNLKFSDQTAESATDSSYVVLAYDTPVDEDDNVDLSILFHAAESLRRTSKNAVIVVSSQVPVGTCEQLSSVLRASNETLRLAYVPENLRLGQAINGFMRPEMLVIGADDRACIARVRELFRPIQTIIIEMNLKSAEMTKHALNTFLSTSISFANELGNICDLVGADALRVVEALKCDSRIGRKAMLRPGLGFSGGTLARDLKILQGIGQKYGYETELINAVIGVNERQNTSIVERVKRLIGSVEGKTVTVFGLTYKAGTSTLRRSAAVAIITRLQEKKAAVKIFDPHIEKVELVSGRTLVCEDAYSACRGSDVLMILNDSSDFVNLDFAKIHALMRNPVILDAQNLLDPQQMARNGFRYFGIGRGSIPLADPI